MTVHTMTLHATMFVSSFIAGIALYYLIAIEQIQHFLQLIEPVIQNVQARNTFAIILRTSATFVVITIFCF